MRSGFAGELVFTRVLSTFSKRSRERRVAAEDIGYLDNNKRLEFIERRSATKRDIKAAVEELFEVKVAKVNTRICKEGKHASVKLAEGYDAEETALKLGAF